MMKILELMRCNAGYADISCIREAAQAPNNDENARTWGWSLLDNLLYVLPYFVHNISGPICYFWIRHR